MNSIRPQAVIFDMDGTLVENHTYHLQAWEQFCSNYHLTTTRKELLDMFGGKNDTIFNRIFGREIPPSQCREYENEKESLYRALYRPHIREVKGLTRLLIQLKQEKIPVGLATSAPTPNVEMILEGLGVKNYFQCIVDAGQIAKGKPDPEIFLKAAYGLETDPASCLVIEDAPAGLQAAQKAGCHCVAILTTHTQEELTDAKIHIKDFTDPLLSFLIFGRRV